MAKIKIGNVRTPIEYLKQFFAPAGYGLGEDLPIVDKEGLDNWTRSGWCIYYDAINPDSTLGGSAFVNCKGNNASITGAVIQEAYQQDGYGAKILTRAQIGGEWKPWEWVNPPMVFNKEYRTTERRNGMPVYRKVVTYKPEATISGSFVVPHGIDNFDALVDAFATINATIPLPLTDNNYTTAVKSVESSGIHISNSNPYFDQNYIWYFYLAYTKKD